VQKLTPKRRKLPPRRRTPPLRYSPPPSRRIGKGRLGGRGKGEREERGKKRKAEQLLNVSEVNTCDSRVRIGRILGKEESETTGLRRSARIRARNRLSGLGKGGKGNLGKGERGIWEKDGFYYY